MFSSPILARGLRLRLGLGLGGYRLGLSDFRVGHAVHGFKASLFLVQAISFSES